MSDYIVQISIKHFSKLTRPQVESVRLPNARGICVHSAYNIYGFLTIMLLMNFCVASGGCSI